MTNERPLLSLCIPTYNRADWLRVGLMALAPMVQLAGGLVEVVVSDNCSPDGNKTANVVREAQSLYPIRFHRQKTNCGLNPNIMSLVNEFARGEYVWVVGEDDDVCNDGLTRLLAVLQARPELNYVHVNHLLYNGPEPLGGSPPPGSVSLYNEDFVDRFLPALSAIVPSEPNCFTAIYSVVLRRALADEAYRCDTEAPAFSTTATVVPHAVYIINNLLQQPAWYLGQPAVVASSSISWKKHQAQYGLVLMHDLYDLMAANGVDPAVMETLRRNRIRSTGSLLWNMLTSPDPTLGYDFSLWEYQKRHGHYPELWATMAELAQHARSLADTSLQRAA
jgi:hypothetical protein